MTPTDRTPLEHTLTSTVQGLASFRIQKFVNSAEEVVFTQAQYCVKGSGVGLWEKLHQSQKVEKLAGGMLQGRAGLVVDGSGFHRQWNIGLKEKKI